MVGYVSFIHCDRVWYLTSLVSVLVPITKTVIVFEKTHCTLKGQKWLNHKCQSLAISLLLIPTLFPTFTCFTKEKFTNIL